MAIAKSKPAPDMAEMDAALADLSNGKDVWARTSIAERIAILDQIKDALLLVSDVWVELATRKKQIPAGSPLAGEEWMSGPYAVMSACNGLIATLSQMEGKAFLGHLKTRQTTTGQLAVKVAPHTIWDHLLMSGVKAEVWMEKSINKANLAANTASAYDISADQRQGRIALVLGAGNIAATAPLDCYSPAFP